MQSNVNAKVSYKLNLLDPFQKKRCSVVDKNMLCCSLTKALSSSRNSLVQLNLDNLILGNMGNKGSHAFHLQKPFLSSNVTKKRKEPFGCCVPPPSQKQIPQLPAYFSKWSWAMIDHCGKYVRHPVLNHLSSRCYQQYLCTLKAVQGNVFRASIEDRGPVLKADESFFSAPVYQLAIHENLA